VRLFVGDHEDEADAMDRWRLRLTKSVHRGERDLTQLHEKVDQLRVRVRVRVS